MIKMVCSDLDGTLLQYGKKLIEGEIFDEIRALHDRGILFCPASGRQYTSLRKLFAPVADDCIYLCENGAVVYRGGKVIAKTPMPRALAEEIAWDFWNNAEDLGEVLLSGENMSDLMERGRGVEDGIVTGETADLVMQYMSMVEKAKTFTEDLDARYEAFADAVAFLIEYALVIPLGMPVPPYLATRLNLWEGQYAPTGLSTNRLKGVHILAHYVAMEEYSQHRDAR